MVGVFLMAAPTSVVSAAIAQGMGGDAELAGAVVVATSLASFACYILWALVI
jgi:predicted permease